MYSVKFLLGLLACLQLGLAQNESEITSHDTPTTFSSRVNLVVVPVVVRDRDGKAVGGLKQEDFQLFDKGKPQIISKFSIETTLGAPQNQAAIQGNAAGNGNRQPSETTPSAAAALPSRFLLYLFDDVHLEFGDLAQARTAALKYLSRSLGSGDRVAIFTTSGQGMLDFTDDREKIREALMRLQPRPIARSSGTDCPEMTYYMADLIQNKNDSQALQAAIQDTIICAELVTVPGMPPPTAQAEQIARGTVSRWLSQGDTESKVALSVLKNAVLRLSSMPGQRTLVLVSPGFLVMNYRPEESEILDKAGRAGITISGIDARGLDARPPGDITSTFHNIQTDFIKERFRRDSELAAADLLGELAAGTGGTWFHNNNDMNAGFDRTSSAPEFRYLLGFSPQSLKNDGSFHALKVTLKESKGLNLQARRGYYAPRHDTDAAEEIKEEIRDAMFSRNELLGIGMDLETQFFKPSDEKARLSVLARVDLKPLHFRKVDGRNRDTLTIVWGVFDRNGNWITGISKTLEMRLKEDTFAARLASGITVKSNFDMTPGSYVIRVVVRDTEGQLMAARNGAIEIP